MQHKVTQTTTAQEQFTSQQQAKITDDLEECAYVEKALASEQKIVVFLDGKDTHVVNYKFNKHDLYMRRVQETDLLQNVEREFDGLRIELDRRGDSQ